jgi:hypothetical protein
MIQSSHLKLLRECGADDARHTGRPLITHLSGTYDILMRWGCSKHVCLAGLFHSVYGTALYETRLLTLGKRAYLRAGIGSRAERLVYIFGCTRRPRAFINAIGRSAFRLDNFVTGEEISLSDKTLSELLEIECANLIDQRLGYEHLEAIARAVECRPSFLKKPVRDELVKALLVWKNRNIQPSPKSS